MAKSTDKPAETSEPESNAELTKLREEKASLAESNAELAKTVEEFQERRDLQTAGQDEPERPPEPGADGIVRLQGSGGKKRLRSFTADYIGDKGIPKIFTVTHCSDESEVVQILRVKYKLNSKTGRFRVVETDDSRDASLQRLTERQKVKRNKPATGGL